MTSQDGITKKEVISLFILTVILHIPGLNWLLAGLYILGARAMWFKQGKYLRVLGLLVTGSIWFCLSLYLVVEKSQTLLYEAMMFGFVAWTLFCVYLSVRFTEVAQVKSIIVTSKIES